MTRPGVILTERDIAVLRSLASLRFLTSAQVQRLHFPSEPTALRRLRRLEAAGLVRRSAAPTISTQVVSLTVRGLETAVDGDAQGSEASALRPPKAPKPLFLRHLVAVNDFRIALLASLPRNPDVELLGFVTDSDRDWGGPGRRPRSLFSTSIDIPGEDPIRHAPDATFLLQRGGRQALFFVEVDCGTEVIGQARHGVGRLVRFYLHALAQGRAHALVPALLRDSKPAAIRILVTTTSTRRLENIRRAWGRRAFVPESLRRLLWLGDFGQLRSRDLLSLPWISLDPDDPELYRIASRKEAE